MKICIKCSLEKPEDSFSWKIVDVKRQSTCKDCHRAYRRQHYLANRQKYIDKARRWESENGGHRYVKVWQKYKLTKDDYLDMLSKNDGKCWVCLEAQAVCVDHDHVTGMVRGMLCHSCNKMLGFARDRVDILQAAMLYLS